MVDPSLLLSEEGVAWLEEDPRARSGIVVSSTAMQWLRGELEMSPSQLVSQEDAELFDRRREQVFGLLDGVPSFRYLRVAFRLRTGQSYESSSETYSFTSSRGRSMPTSGRSFSPSQRSSPS
jgi:hypothetical protein